jgi:hypothetical protein
MMAPLGLSMSPKTGATIFCFPNMEEAFVLQKLQEHFHTQYVRMTPIKFLSPKTFIFVPQIKTILHRPMSHHQHMKSPILANNQHA